MSGLREKATGVVKRLAAARPPADLGGGGGGGGGAGPPPRGAGGYNRGMSGLREKATGVVKRLAAAGHQAYLVGGCVRDLVLGREPTDYDVATDATPDQVAKLFPKAVMVGAQFGVVKVLLEGDEIEVATFRSDHGTLDGRHPRAVRYARTPEEDDRKSTRLTPVTVPSRMPSS